MSAELFFTAVLLIGMIAGTYTDLKNRWVPDFVNFSLIAIGLGGHAILSVLNQSIWPLAYSIGGAIAFYAIGGIMYYTGIWGGGDAKLLIGVGALLPNHPIAAVAPWPFLATLLFNILLFGSGLTE